MPIVLAEADPTDILPWIDGADLAACTPDATPDQRDDYAEAASDLLFRLTGNQFGTATSVGRPNVCAERCGCGYARDFVAYWTEYGSGWPYGYGWSCSCRSTSFRFDTPVTEIVSVVVDGQPVDPGSYQLYEGDTLVRVDGGVWPCCQNIEVPATEAGTWQVTFTHGVPVPAAGRLAALELACELGKAFASDDTCRLPKRTQSLTRQNVTVQFADPKAILDDGLTGLPTVDLFISATDPKRRKPRPSLMSAATARRMMRSS